MSFGGSMVKHKCQCGTEFECHEHFAVPCPKCGKLDSSYPYWETV